MAKLNKECDRLWMEALAKKHGIDVETVGNFYTTLEGRDKHRRTVEFFDLYFEGRNENAN